MRSYHFFKAIVTWREFFNHVADEGRCFSAGFFYLFICRLSQRYGSFNLILSLFLINQNMYSQLAKFVYVICAMLHRRSLTPSLILQ